MRKIITHEANGAVHVLVEVSEGSYAYKVFKDEEPYLSVIQRINGIIETPRIYLPPGQYEIIGLADQLSEEQCKEIVELGEHPADGSACFFSYQEPLDYVAVNAVASLHSLLRSHSLTPSTCLVLRKK